MRLQLYAEGLVFFCIRINDGLVGYVKITLPGKMKDQPSFKTVTNTKQFTEILFFMDPNPRVRFQNPM